jgi:hypothetical protein
LQRKFEKHRPKNIQGSTTSLIFVPKEVVDKKKAQTLKAERPGFFYYSLAV